MTLNQQKCQSTFNLLGYKYIFSIIRPCPITTTQTGPIIFEASGSARCKEPSLPTTPE